MGIQEFDDRYPAMFQPGGEELPAAYDAVPQLPYEAAPAAERTREPAHEEAAPAAERARKPAHEPVHEPAPGSAHVPAPDPELLPASGPSEVSTRRWWRVPVALGVILVLAGCIIPFIPSLLADGTEGYGRTPMFNGISVDMWSYTLTPVAKPFLEIGLLALIFVPMWFSLQLPSRRVGLRRLLWICAGLLVGAGLVMLTRRAMVSMTTTMVDAASGEVLSQWSAANTSVILGLLAPAPVMVGVLTAAALLAGQAFASMRLLLVGLGTSAAAVVVLFAPQLFPNAPLMGGVGGYQLSLPQFLPELAPAMAASAGMILLGAAIRPLLATRLRRASIQPGGAAEDAGSEQDPPDGVEL